MLNHVDMMGRLVADPTMKMTKNNVSVASFRIACDRDIGEKKTDFFNCTAWRQTGEFIGKNFRKGQMIVISGRIQNNDWEDKDGNKRTTEEILVEHAYFCQKAEVSETKFTEIIDDEDVPF